MQINTDNLNEYKNLFDNLSNIGKCVDVLKNHHDCHLYTFGYNGEHLIHYDQVLTDKDDYGSFQTLDYIFEIFVEQNNILKKNYSSQNDELTLSIRKNNNLETPDTNEKKLTVDYTSSKVEHFLVHEKPYQQLSDHFGLSVSLEYN